jgi:hypothetical protein
LSETYSWSKIDNVVVISPNHFNYNWLLAETMPKDWILCFQKECIKTYTFNSIEKKVHFFTPVFKPKTYSNEETNSSYTTQEHWIWVHISYINKYFPNTKFYPLVINRKFRDIKNSSNQIVKIIEEEFWVLKDFEEIPVSSSEKQKEKWNTLFIASVDFSHHVDEEFAVEHDKRTVASLSYWDLEWVEVDCPNCLQTIYDIASNSWKNCFNEYKRTSVDIVLNIKSWVENTSHIYWDYSVCENPKTTPITWIIFWKYNSVEDLSLFYEQNNTTKDPKFYYHTPLTWFDIIATTSDESEDLTKFPFNHFVFKDEKKTFEIRNKSVIFYSLSEDDYSEEITKRLENFKQDNIIIVFVYRKTLENSSILYELAEVANIVIWVPDEDADFDIYEIWEVEEYNWSMIYHSIWNINNYVIFEVD